MRNRAGISLVELVVVIAILGLLLGIVLAAIQRARQAAVREESANNVRQLLIALHNYASANDGRLPGVIDPEFPDVGDDDLYQELTSYIDGQYLTLGEVNSTTVPGWPLPPMPRQVPKVFVSPADPSFHLPGQNLMDRGVCSYAVNIGAFAGPPKLTGSITDGTSQTIAFAEHYSNCVQPESWTAYRNNMPRRRYPDPFPYIGRAATFADGVYGDVRPVPSGQAGVTVGSEPGLTFQVAPRLDQCNPRLPQTPHRAGMLIGLVDGSVRLIRGTIEPTQFWAAVTPSAGDHATLD